MIEANARLRPMTRVFAKFWWIPFGIMLLSLPVLASSYHLQLANLVMLASIGALSLNVLMGNTGLISIGHAAFAGCGAFTSAVLLTQFGIPGWLTLPASLAAGATAGLIASLPAIRLRGLYLILSTMATHYIVVFVAGEYQSRGGHSAGIAMSRLGVGEFVLNNNTKWYYFLLVVVALITLFVVNLLRSRMGRAWAAIRDREVAAAALGIDVAGYRILAFMFSSALAALMGSLAAFYAGYVSVSDYTLWSAISYAVMVLIGGLRSVMGSFLGAAFVVLLPYGIEAAFRMVDVPTRLATALYTIKFGLFGLFIILFLLYERRGLVGIIEQAAARLKNIRSGTGAHGTIHRQDASLPVAEPSTRH